MTLDLKLVRAIDTHTHADHITALGDLRTATGCVTIMGEFTKASCVSEQIREGETLNVDGIRLQALYTPGHTDESFSFVLDPAAAEAVFTGDVLLIRGSGRTDFQGGDPRKSWDSIVNKLFRLPDDGHRLSRPRLQGLECLVDRRGKAPQPAPGRQDRSRVRGDHERPEPAESEADGHRRAGQSGLRERLRPWPMTTPGPAG